LDKISVSKAMKGVDTVYHMAALVGVDRVMNKDEMVWKIDHEGTKNVLEAAVENGVKRIIFASSSEVYGKFDQESLPMNESQPFEPDTLYGVAKLKAEKLVADYAKEHGFTGVSVRYFNVYGPRQTLNGYCVPHFIDASIKGEEICIHGDGCQTRDLTYVDDAVRLTMALLDDKIKPKANGEVFNIGTGFSISMNDLAGKIIYMTLSDSKMVHIPMRRPTDGYHKQGDASKILNVTGLKPEVSLGDGLERTIAAAYRKL